MNKFKSGDIVYIIKNGIQPFLLDQEEDTMLSEDIRLPIGSQCIIQTQCSCGCNGYLTDQFANIIPAHCLAYTYKTPRGNRPV